MYKYVSHTLCNDNLSCVMCVCRICVYVCMCITISIFKFNFPLIVHCQKKCGNKYFITLYIAHTMNFPNFRTINDNINLYNIWYLNVQNMNLLFNFISMRLQNLIFKLTQSVFSKCILCVIRVFVSYLLCTKVSTCVYLGFGKIPLHHLSYHFLFQCCLKIPANLIRI